MGNSNSNSSHKYAGHTHRRVSPEEHQTRKPEEPRAHPAPKSNGGGGGCPFLLSQSSQLQNETPHEQSFGINGNLMLYKEVFDYSPDACIVMEDDIILRVNESCLSMLGYKREELEGKPLPSIIPERFREAHHTGFQRYLAQGYGKIIGSRKGVEVFALHKDGHEIPVELAMSSIKKSNDKYQFIGFFRDLSSLVLERKKKEKLLYSMMPEQIATRLMNKAPDELIADSYASCTIGFVDIVGFTPLSSGISAQNLVRLLDRLFVQFDNTIASNGAQKLKNIGDACMFVCGVPVERQDHASVVVNVGLGLIRDVQKLKQALLVESQDTMTSSSPPSSLNIPAISNLQVRVGANTGPVIAAVIGTETPSFDIFGDACNVASRMESSGVPMHVQISETTYQSLVQYYHSSSRFPKNWQVRDRGMIAVKGKGDLGTFLISERADACS